MSIQALGLNGDCNLGEVIMNIDRQRAADIANVTIVHIDTWIKTFQCGCPTVL